MLLPLDVPPLLWRLRLPLAFLSASLALGTAGYVLIEGWTWLESFFMVVITFTTIGYGETRPLSDLGRVFTIFLIVTGLSVGTYTVGDVTRYVVDGGLTRDLEASRQRRRRMVLRDHYLVVGLGRLGQEVAQNLLREGHRVAVIDQRAEAVEACGADVVGIVGDATHDAVLLEAGVDRARGLAIALPSPADAVYTALTARQLNPALTIGVRIDDALQAPKARRAGADFVLNPYHSGGARLAHELVHPHAASFIQHAVDRSVGDYAVDDVRVGAGRVLGSLASLKPRDTWGVLVVAIRKADGTLVNTPGPQDTLAAGDVAVVVGPPASIRAFAAAASPPTARPPTAGTPTS